MMNANRRYLPQGGNNMGSMGPMGSMGAYVMMGSMNTMGYPGMGYMPSSY